MAIRTKSEIALQVGRNNQLTNTLFDTELSQDLITMSHSSVHEATLDKGEANHQVPFGDVAQARLVLVQADGPVRISPAGGIASAAKVTGSGGTFPTGFAGGEELDLEIDGTAFTVAFENADETLDEVINRINSAAMLADIRDASGDPKSVALEEGGELQIVSPTVGESSEVVIASSTDSAVLTTLGLTAGTTNGTNAQPGQTPVELRVPSSEAAGGPVDTQAFLFATMVTTAITLENLDPDNKLRVVVAVIGDLLTSPPSC